MKKLTIVIVTIVCLSIAHRGASQIVTDKLPRSTPEAEGVSSAGIIDFLNAVDTANLVEIHSVMVIRHGKVISEGWWNPYGAEYKHIMFSASKTFTATAIGLAASENRLKVSDKVISFFPNSLPDTLSAYSKALTIKDLLTMSAGQDPAPNFGNEDWVRGFLNTKIVKEPGTTFLYNGGATFMLSAIIQQVTGQTVFDYLTPRLFKPLGIRGIDWEQNPQGINLGRAGMRLHTEDMAKFALLLEQNGMWKGKQLVPAAWVKEATSFKIESRDPGNKRPKELNDWAQGYCYQMWRGRYNTVRFDGARGQWGILIPDKDAVVILTSNARNTQRELDLVWKFLLPAMKDVASLPADAKTNTVLNQRLASLKLGVAGVAAAPSKLSQTISGKEFKLDGSSTDISSISFTMGNNNISTLTINRNGVSSQVKMGNTMWVTSNTNVSTFTQPSPLITRSTDAAFRLIDPPHKVAAYSLWLDANTLQVSTRFIEDNAGEEITVFTFNESQGTVTMEQKGATATAPSKTFTGKIVSAR